MFKKYVYYVLKEKRLIISDKIINDNYVQLLEVCGGNLSLLMINCNGFCAGYVLACKNNNIDISNMLDEFGTCC
jgi:hypothetical protein